MDGNMISSLTGTSSKGQEKKKATKADGDAFAAALDDAKGKGDAGKANASMIDEPKGDKEKAHEKEEKEAQKKAAAQHESGHEAKVANSRDLRDSSAVRKLMQNVNTMSLAEKQSLRVGEFSQEGMQKAEVAQLAQHLGQGPVLPGTTMAYPGSLTLGVRQAGTKAGMGAEAGKEAMRESKPEDRKAQAAELVKAGNQPTLEQLIAKESDHTQELQKASQLSQTQERQAVIDQILQKIEVRNLANKTELHLRLNPEYLGELKVKLTHTAEGGVHAEFQTTSRTTRKVLEENQDDLRTQARGKGVRLGQMRVQLVDNV